MKIGSISVLLLLLTCVTADKSIQDIPVTRGIADDPRFDPADVRDFETDTLRISLLYVSPHGTFGDRILSNFLVDSEGAALHQLSNGYVLAAITATNISDTEQSIPPALLSHEWRHEQLAPLVSRSEYPATLTCLNWKGTIKDIYNVTAVTATTLFVIGSFAECLGKGHCQNMKYVDDALRLSTSGTMNAAEAFSSPFFRSRVQYSDIFELRDATLAPRQVKRGLLLFKRPFFARDPDRYLTNANCLIQ